MFKDRFGKSCIPFQINDIVKGTIVRLSSVADKIIDEKHPDKIKSIFADSIAITATLGSRMKNDGVFSLQVKSNGLIKTILVDINNNSSIRGYILFKKDPKIKLTFDNFFHDGHLALTINEGKFSNNYQGIVGIEGKSLQDSIQSYFNSSQQTKTYFKTFNIYDLSNEKDTKKNFITGAIKIELMPQTEASNLIRGEDLIWEEIKLFLNTMSSKEFLDKKISLKQILCRLFGQYKIKVFDEIHLNNSCRCSRKKVVDTLKSMKVEELNFLFKKNENLEIVCEFCKRKRLIFKKDLQIF